jgi:hypothetical protein
MLQVVVSGALDYSNPEVQQDLLDLLARLENTTYIDPVYTESWLRNDYCTSFTFHHIVNTLKYQIASSFQRR